MKEEENKEPPGRDKKNNFLPKKVGVIFSEVKKEYFPKKLLPIVDG